MPARPPCMLIAWPGVSIELRGVRDPSGRNPPWFDRHQPYGSATASGTSLVVSRMTNGSAPCQPYRRHPASLRPWVAVAVRMRFGIQRSSEAPCHQATLSSSSFPPDRKPRGWKPSGYQSWGILRPDGPLINDGCPCRRRVSRGYWLAVKASGNSSIDAVKLGRGKERWTVLTM
ncbi:hypothetical protein BO78DRAFT_234488 [Aspergillus sclerotiicarbonarius CBS 121057]|uniref:Uncharacterized protein n=1 Tax=Aspergillus sclerotiicarbonarius (strain CBS 121057 / IBT 28362) TaxID=1448318 RepID=A0A319ELF2_ASPSB|nr:hypothetical protein BO78DRAFT_234488 [Aspergillus sclerotiicarbonarius CBS 121057]